MSHLRRHLAPISDEVWTLLDTEATSRLTTQLAARRVVDFHGPLGWAHAATSLGRTTELASPTEGVSALQRRVAPLVELRTTLSVSRVDLDDADRGAVDLNLAELDQAARQMAVAENVLVFHGYEAAGIRGVTESTSHPPVELGDDPSRYPSAVARGTDALRRAGIDGPYALVLGPELYTRIVETAEHGGHLLFDHLGRILGGPIVWAPGVRAGVLLSVRGGDFRLDSGEDLSLGYLEHDADVVRLYLEESLTFSVLEPDAAVALSVDA